MEIFIFWTLRIFEGHQEKSRDTVESNVSLGVRDTSEKLRDTEGHFKILRDTEGHEIRPRDT